MKEAGSKTIDSIDVYGFLGKFFLASSALKIVHLVV
jgi:hypothetical protein